MSSGSKEVWVRSVENSREWELAHAFLRVYSIRNSWLAWSSVYLARRQMWQPTAEHDGCGMPELMGKVCWFMIVVRKGPTLFNISYASGLVAVLEQ